MTPFGQSGTNLAKKEGSDGIGVEAWEGRGLVARVRAR